LYILCKKLEIKILNVVLYITDFKNHTKLNWQVVMGGIQWLVFSYTIIWLWSFSWKTKYLLY